MSSAMRLQWLKWANVLAPPLVVWVYETIRHTVLEGERGAWKGNVLAALGVLLISYLLSQVVFGLIARIQARLIQQNKELEELNQRVRELAIIEERSLLAREIHDGLAQLLAYIMMKMDVIETLLSMKRLAEAEKELEQARNACEEAYGNVREAISGLRPEFLDGRDFVTLLGDLLKRFADDNRVQAQLELEGIEPESTQISQFFPAAFSMQLVRVVQESLSNIRKHAQARTVKIQVSVNGVTASDLKTSASNQAHLVVLSITDDGCGFDLGTSQQQGQHFGLAIMRERVESMAGRFEIISQFGQGTTVQISLPLGKTVRL